MACKMFIFGPDLSNFVAHSFVGHEFLPLTVINKKIFL